MKKTALFLALGLILSMNQACKKNSTTTVSELNETVDVTVNAGDSYQYTFTGPGDSEPYSIETEGSKSAVVTIENNSTGSTFVYTPDKTSSGTDVVVISNTISKQNQVNECGDKPAHKGGGHCKKGNKEHHHGHHKKNCSTAAKHNITFNITVNGIQN